jgi:hypothetical protein
LKPAVELARIDKDAGMKMIELARIDKDAGMKMKFLNGI